MTPRETAEQIVNSVTMFSAEKTIVAEAIEAALLAERERCARIAEELAHQCDIIEAKLQTSEDKAYYLGGAAYARHIITAVNDSEWGKEKSESHYTGYRADTAIRSNEG